MTLQPVVMDPAFVSRDRVRPDNVLHPEEQFLGHDRLVRSVVFDALVADDSDVVGVLKNPVDLRRYER
jgi:hypothetical protein